MSKQQRSLAEIDELGRDEFVQLLGGIFEHSPWIAEQTWFKRPFTSVDNLYQALCKTVRSSTEEHKLALICAHPDLVGRAGVAGTLTKESTNEQASAGLNNLSAEEVALFDKQNNAYRTKFGFPFVICARLNKKEAILRGFEVRLQNSREQEILAALEEIFKIARLRLEDIVGNE